MFSNTIPLQLIFSLFKLKIKKTFKEYLNNITKSAIFFIIAIKWQILSKKFIK